MYNGCSFGNLCGRSTWEGKYVKRIARTRSMLTFRFNPVSISSFKRYIVTAGPLSSTCGVVLLLLKIQPNGKLTFGKTSCASSANSPFLVQSFLEESLSTLPPSTRHISSSSLKASSMSFS